MPEWTFARITDRGVKPALFALCLVPITLLVWAAVTGRLSANPLEDIRDTIGIWTLRFLLITLSITPLRRITHWHSLTRFRRMLGLFAFFYAVLHLVTYVWFDQFFDVSEMIDDLSKRRFIMAGYASFVLIVPLAITSTKGWIVRMGGKNWQLLHRLIYISAAAGVLHYFWRVKLDISRPAIYAIILGALLIFRVLRKRRYGANIAALCSLF